MPPPCQLQLQRPWAVAGIWMTTGAGVGGRRKRKTAELIPNPSAATTMAMAPHGGPFRPRVSMIGGGGTDGIEGWAGMGAYACAGGWNGDGAVGIGAVGAGGLAKGSATATGAAIGAGSGVKDGPVRGAASSTGTSSSFSAVARREVKGTTLLRAAVATVADAAGCWGAGPRGGGRGAPAVGARGGGGAGRGCWAGGGGPHFGRRGRQGGPRRRRRLAHDGRQLRERAHRTPLVEPFLPGERVLGHGAQGGFAAHLRNANGPDGYAVDGHIPLVARRQVGHVEGCRDFFLALDVGLEGAGKGAGRLVRLGGGLGRGKAGRQRSGPRCCARGRRSRRPSFHVRVRVLALRRLSLGGGDGGHARLGDRRANLDEVSALAALHSYRLTGDLFVANLVLGLALFAEKLHGPRPSAKTLSRKGGATRAVRLASLDAL